MSRSSGKCQFIGFGGENPSSGNTGKMSRSKIAMSSAPATQRLLFANQLRGLAALAVVATHLIGVFWSERDYIAGMTASPQQHGPVPALFALVGQPWLNFGPFGVAVFFLISGLVIPFSLERHSRGGFLLARWLRIFPTYMLALLLGLAVLYGASLFWQIPMSFNPLRIISNLLLINQYTGHASFDMVSWTLVIELKFYLIMCLFAGAVLRGSIVVLFAIAAAMLAFNLYLHAGFWLPGFARQLIIDSLWLIFMLVGVVFNYHVHGLLRSGPAALAVAGLLALFVCCWTISGIASQFPLITLHYGYAVALFAAAYLARHRARPVAILDFFADISYPLYLVHTLVGYSVLKLAMLAWQLPYPAALALAFAVAVLVAWVLHVTVERASIDLGRRCTRRPRQQTGANLAFIARLQSVGE